MIKQLIKKIVFGTIESPFFQVATKTIFDRKYIFLMYHGISKDGQCEEDWLQLEESDFRDQMEHLAANYDVISLKDILDGTVKRRRSGPGIVITFDDGYSNNHSIAYPILNRLGLPATIFLVTNRIDTQNMFWYDKIFSALPREKGIHWVRDKVCDFKMYHPHTVDDKVDEFMRDRGYSVPAQASDCYAILNTDQIQEMADSGLITFGSHTHEHELLTRMDDAEVYQTLQTSFNIMESVPGNIPVFCYPNGWYKDHHINFLNNIGYQLAVRADHDKNGIWNSKENDYEIPRWGIGRGIPLKRFTAMVSGSLELLRRFGGKLKRPPKVKGI